MSQQSIVRNPDGWWINTAEFTREAQHFTKYGYYTAAPWGSEDWRQYWREQLRRCEEGYSVGGVRITGNHYFYLNFTRIMISAGEGNNKRKIRAFPSFWDGDYDYFHVLEIAKQGITEEELAKLHLEVRPLHLGGNKHLVVGKARRKGYSFKNSAICANMYNIRRDSRCIIGAYDKKYLYPKEDAIMTMVKTHLDFLNEQTGWAKKRLIDRQDHIKAGFIEKINGQDVPRGFKSEVFAFSFQNDPDAGRGKSADYFIFEEGGAWPGLESAFMAVKPALEDGDFTIGTGIVFGTGGDMEKGTIDFANMYFNPDDYNCLAFENIWEENTGKSVGFFHPTDRNFIGYIDKAGNSDRQGVIAREKALRASITRSSTLDKHIQEYPFGPSEAFLVSTGNIFPAVELRKVYDKLMRSEGNKGRPAYIYKQDGEVKIEYDLTGTLRPIEKFPIDETEEGAVVIFEEPQYFDKIDQATGEKVKQIPRGLYKIGYDPYRQNKGTSHGSAMVFKTLSEFSSTGDTIVAEYTGRPETVEDFHRTVMYLAEFYNAEVMFENEVTSVVPFFRGHKKLQYLSAQPDAVISANINKSTVARIYGIHMVEKLKEAGISYINKWLRTERDFDENGKAILNMETIKSPALLLEMIKYDGNINVDRIMALAMVMFSVEEEREIIKKKRQRQEHKTAQYLNELFEDLRA